MTSEQRRRDNSPKEGTMKDDHVIDLLGCLRRVAISNPAQIVSAIQSALVRAPESLTKRLSRIHAKQETAIFQALDSNRDTRLRQVGMADLFGVSTSEAVLKALDEGLAKLPTGEEAAIAMIDDYILRKAQVIAPDSIQTLVSALRLPQRLPLIDRVVENANRDDLSDTVVIATQHLLGSVLPEFDALVRLGVDPGHIAVLGKPYSSNRAVALALQSRGISVSSRSLEFPPSNLTSVEEFERTTAHACRLLVRWARDRLRASRHLRLLVLDDGGVLIESVLRSKVIMSLPNRVTAVEQTSGGIRRLNRRGRVIAFPVVNVAMSRTKLTRESELIARSIVHELENRIRQLRKSDANVPQLESSKILLIGYGSVGAYVGKALQELKVQPYVFDTENRQIAVAGSHGFKDVIELSRGLHEADVIIGCTGYSSLPEESWTSIHDGAVLVSGSSGNREFNGAMRHVKERNRPFWASSFEEDSDFQRVHGDYSVRLLDKTAWVCNAGFPVNFSGAIDPIEAKHIQLTRSLMVSGALQSVSERHHGIVDLSSERGLDIADHFGLTGTE
jgi:hypothetical protein